MFRNVIRLKKNSFQLSYSTAKQSHKCIVRILYVCMYVCMYVFHLCMFFIWILMGHSLIGLVCSSVSARLILSSFQNDTLKGWFVKFLKYIILNIYDSIYNGLHHDDILPPYSSFIGSLWLELRFNNHSTG